MKSQRKDGYRVEDGKICIDLSLKDPKQLFDSRDPAPFLERDLDDDAVDYIVSGVQEFPSKTKMKLHIFFSQKDQSTISDSEIFASIRHYFKYMEDMASKKLARSIKNAQFFLFCGVILLIGCLTTVELLSSFEHITIIKLIRSGLEIAGWVALWRPLELLFFDWWPMYERRKSMNKVATMDISITDTKTNFITTTELPQNKLTNPFN